MDLDRHLSSWECGRLRRRIVAPHMSRSTNDEQSPGTVVKRMLTFVWMLIPMAASVVLLLFREPPLPALSVFFFVGIVVLTVRNVFRAMRVRT